MREELETALKQATKGQEKRRLGTVRLIRAAIADRDIALRGHGKDRADDEEILDILARMVKQREESVRMYREGGRTDLADQEQEEMAIIREFLPRQYSDDEAQAAVRSAIEQTGATSLRDMGKVMGVLKEKHRGQIDMAKAGAMVKAAF